jgi:hypothetical protein
VAANLAEVFGMVQKWLARDKKHPDLINNPKSPSIILTFNPSIFLIDVNL